MLSHSLAMALVCFMGATSLYSNYPENNIPLLLEKATHGEIDHFSIKEIDSVTNTETSVSIDSTETSDSRMRFLQITGILCWTWPMATIAGKNKNLNMLALATGLGVALTVAHDLFNSKRRLTTATITHKDGDFSTTEVTTFDTPKRYPLRIIARNIALTVAVHLMGNLTYSLVSNKTIDQLYIINS